MTMRPRFLAALVVVVSVSLLSISGCAVQQRVAAPPVTMRCVYPEITPLPETSELQTKGGINLSLAPGAFECTESFQDSKSEVSSTFSQRLALNLNLKDGDNVANYKLIETTSTPVYKVISEKVRFLVKINNQMSRVFRGAGTVILYNFGGRNVSIDREDYAELSNIIVPPRTETQVTIYGPAFDDIEENTTLGIFLYDVVTEQDDAGNIVEKQNFEWYYNYRTAVKEKAGRPAAKSLEWVRR